jgi:dTDP-glucose 4,6-dehydratase
MDFRKLGEILSSSDRNEEIRTSQAVHETASRPSSPSWALRNEPLTNFGDGSQTRSFCYVSDLIQGFIRLAMIAGHGPVNIGNPVEMTIREFAERMIEIVGCASGMEYRPLPVDDPKARQPDITRARSSSAGS